MPKCTAKALLEQEAYALRARLDSVKPFAMHMPMVMAAAVSPAAQAAIECHLQSSGRRLQSLIKNYVHWLHSPDGRRSPPAIAQRRLTSLRLRFSAVLSQFDIFAEAVTQRSEHDYGVWLAGLDHLAEDALQLPGDYISSPPMICYLDRGLGAAIRRVRTRLPGGSKSPVTIIRVPRERMIGSAVASSIVHEVGHQAAALLKLVDAFKPVFRRQQAKAGNRAHVWEFFERWIGEMVADFWSVGKVCITGTLGIMTVVSLPRPFVFRITPDDVHPTPWLRVKLSCAMGSELYPHPQWGHIARVWEKLYPMKGLNPEQVQLLSEIDAEIPSAVKIIAEHRLPVLDGKCLREVMPADSRRPDQLAERFKDWQDQPELMNSDSPTLAFAVLGQAKFDGELRPDEESRLLNASLKHWALRKAVETGVKCARSISGRYENDQHSDKIDFEDKTLTL